MTKRKKELQKKVIENYTDKLGEPIGDVLDTHLLGVADPNFGAAATINIIAHFGKDDNVTESCQLAAEAIESQTTAYLDDAVIESSKLLYQQVLTLNTLFNKLTQMSIMTLNGSSFEAMFDAAMKAQEQSRRTLETLAEIRNPRPSAVYIKHAIASQVNQLTVKTSELEKMIKGGKSSPIEIIPSEIENELLIEV